MKQQVNLLKGKIFPALTALALPIMLTSLVQMAYNLTDMIWIGRLSADAVAAVGAASMFSWLSRGMGIVARMGGQVLVAQKLGSGKEEEAVLYAQALSLIHIFRPSECRRRHWQASAVSLPHPNRRAYTPDRLLQIFQDIRWIRRILRRHSPWPSAR